MVPRPKRSPEFEHYCKTLKCPNGHARSLRYVEGSGEVVGDLELRDRLLLENPIPAVEQNLGTNRFLHRLRQFNHELWGALSFDRFRIDSAIECMICQAQWPVFLQQNPLFTIISEKGPRLIETPYLTEKCPPHDGRNSIKDFMEKKSYSQIWVKKLEVDWERATTRGTKTSASLKAAIEGVGIDYKIERRFEERLSSRYSLLSETQTVSGSDIEVPVIAGKITQVTINWVQIWHEYECEVRLEDGRIMVVPYRIPVKLSPGYEITHT